MGSLLPVPRFPLPENWEPEGVTCVSFVIPDDPEYLAVLTGLVDELKWSRSFARDDTGEGAAIVSRTWAKALETRIFQTGECDVAQIRVNPDCSVDVNCGTVEDPDWQPVLTADHPEGGAKIPYPPGTDEYEDDTARCISAANITAQLKYGVETLSGDAAIVAGIAIAIIDVLAVFLVFVPGGVLVDIAIAIINLAIGHVASDFTDDLPDIDWEDVRDNLACFIERDGSVTEADRETFLAWMDGEYVGNLAWGLAKIVVQNVTADGLTVDARMPQDAIDIVCTDVCGWHYDIDFTASSGAGVWVSDLGMIWSIGQGWLQYGSSLHLDADGTVPYAGTITHVKIEYNAAAGGTDGADAFRSVASGSLSCDLTQGMSAGVGALEWFGLTCLSGERWLLSFGGLSGNLYITRLVVDGHP